MEEHVWFYGCLKGLTEAEVKAELDTLLSDVGLLHKRHEQTKNLSGNSNFCIKLSSEPHLHQFVDSIFIFVRKLVNFVFLK